MKKKGLKSIVKFSVAFFSVSWVAALPAIINNANQDVLSINKSDSQNQAINGNNGTTGSTIEKSLVFNINKNPSWAGKYFADEVTAEMIQELLEPTTPYGANYFVNIEPITTEMQTQGYVNFTVTQIKNEYDSNGLVVGAKEVKIPPTKVDVSSGNSNGGGVANGNSGNPDMAAGSTTSTTTNGTNYTWTTKNITNDSNGLFKPRKYKFSWNTDKEIGDYLMSTTSTINNVKNEDVFNNLVSTADSTDILPTGSSAQVLYPMNGTVANGSQNMPSTKIQTTTTSSDTISDEDAKKYGVAKVKITFGSESGSSGLLQTGTNSNWVDGEVPSGTKVEKIVRGFDDTNGDKHTIYLAANSNSIKSTTFDVNKIKQQNPNFQEPFSTNSSNTAKISDFFPSQLVNALNGDLVSLLTTTEYFPTSTTTGQQKTTTLPALYLEYMGKNAFTDSSLPFKGTGLSALTNIPYVDKNYNPIYESDGKTQKTTGSTSVNNLLTITGIDANAIDEEGKLELKVRYNYYDIFYNVMVSNKEEVVTITGMKKNKDANKNLYFDWKSNDDLLYSSATDFLNAYESNKENQAYLKDLTNTLFYGSTDTYQKDRTVSVEQVNTNGNTNQLKVTLTFPEFGGEWYLDGSNKKEGKKFEQTFTFKTSGTGSTSFSSQKSVESAIKAAGYDLSTLTPQKLIDLISEGKINKNIFFGSSKANEQVLFTSNASNNGLIVQVYDGTNLYTNFYTGLAQGESENFVYNFSFSEDSMPEAYKKLLTIPVEDITKQDVINYLNELSPFNVAGSQFFDSLTEQNIELVPDPQNGSLKVSVTIPQYDASIENANRTFTTVIQGLTSQKLVDDNSYVAPLNLTIPLSATFAGVVVIGLSSVLIVMIRKRIKLKQSKKEHALHDEQTKKNK